MSAYFVRTGPGTFRATEHTGGAWNPAEQHISPTTGLVLHEVERHVGDDGLVVGRITMEILGVVAIDDVAVEVEVLRPGRTIQLVEATVRQGGRPVVRARVWRLAVHDTAAVAGGGPDPLPHPDTLAEQSLDGLWPGHYIRSLRARAVRPSAPGRSTVWLRSVVDLVEGEEAGDLATYAALVDTANGTGPLLSATDWLFPNLELSIHLHRAPVAPWVGLDTTGTVGPTGQGVTSTVLHDVHGPVGRAEQLLTVRPRPPDK